MEPTALLSCSLGARLEMVHAVEPYPWPASEARQVTTAPPSTVAVTLERRAQEELDASAARRLGAVAQSVETSVTMGESATEAILGRAAQSHADLIVMSSAKPSRPADWIRGSLAEEVARHAPCAVLVTREGSDIRGLLADDLGVLAAVDLDEECENVTRMARAVASELDQSLELLHVIPGPVAPAPRLSPVSAAAVELSVLRSHSQARAVAEERLGALSASPQDTVSVGVGDPVDEILQRAQVGGHGLVVVGAANRGELGQLFLGSVCEAVMRRASCPVLIVPSAGETLTPAAATLCERTHEQSMVPMPGTVAVAVA